MQQDCTHIPFQHWPHFVNRSTTGVKESFVDFISEMVSDEDIEKSNDCQCGEDDQSSSPFDIVENSEDKVDTVASQ